MKTTHSTPNGPITCDLFGTTHDGVAVERFTLRNAHGLQAQIATYGGTVTSLSVPDRRGHFDDIVLGFDSLDGYLHDGSYFGALVGRYANRIARGQFRLDGKDYALATNDPPNALHGGRRGFDKTVWQVERATVSAQGPQLVLRHLSPEGDEGYPGNLSVEAIYTLTAEDGLRLDYTATSDRPTIVNLTQHSYFNLRGSRRLRDILGHEVQIHASQFTPVDATCIPTGELRAVTDTPFDFTAPTAIGARIHDNDQQLAFGRGYDHNFVLDEARGHIGLAATVHEPESGRVLEVLCTHPGLQFYTGNFLDGTLLGKDGAIYAHRSGFCMEPQHFPDSPNQPAFPPTVLRPGETYRHTILYRFTAR